MQQKRTKLVGKLTPKSTEFHPIQHKQRSSDHLDTVIQTMMNSNEGHVFANEFTRLTSYTNIEELRTIASLNMLNSTELKFESPDKLVFVIVTSSSTDDIHKSMKYGI